MKELLEKMKQDMEFIRDEIKLQAHLGKAEIADKGVKVEKMVDGVKEDLQSLKDELKLQAHLGKVEAEEELKKLERDFDGMVSKYKPLADEAGKTAENTGAALKTAAEELIAGMDRLRKML